ncbi:MAG: hypothetical protein J5825_11545, partial [Lachnospiraceae bacterium]|nr:hypothetical protein [Lachnospiraceae bacterium]
PDVKERLGSLKSETNLPKSSEQTGTSERPIFTAILALNGGFEWISADSKPKSSWMSTDYRSNE